jgi:DNA-binding response OmpR family regulator
MRAVASARSVASSSPTVRRIPACLQRVCSPFTQRAPRGSVRTSSKAVDSASAIRLSSRMALGDRGPPTPENLHASKMKSRILVVAVDASLRAMLARWLMVAGYAVELAESAKRAREVAASEDIALAILAPHRLDGAADVAEAVGHVILIAAPPEEVGAASISIPASSYICQPLREQDVLARIEAALRTEPEVEAVPELLCFEGYTLDVIGRACRDPKGAELSLTRAEFSLLLALARRPGRVLSRDELRRAMVGRDAEPDDRSVDVLISRLRRKIEPDPKAPRMIVTVPGEGYKLGVKSRASVPSAEMGPPLGVAPPAAARGIPAAAATRGASVEEASVQTPELQSSDSPEPVTIASPPLGPQRSAPPRTMMVGAAAAVAGVAGGLFAFWYLGYETKIGPTTVGPAAKFDAAAIPLVNDAARQELASYATRPDIKALAISAAPGHGWGIAFGAPDTDSAKREALDRCSVSSAPRICKIYAVGMNVVWSAASLPLPMPADIHMEPMDIPLVVAEIPMLTDASRQVVTEKYVNLPGHKALAIRRNEYFWNGAGSRAEAERLAIQRCSDLQQAPCLLLSSDGLLTVQIPKSHPIEDIFMLTTEPAMSEQDKEGVGRIYQEGEWRALARGKSGGWYPVANAPSESAAVDAALGACAQRENECRLYAIGNFRVAADR